MNELKIHFPILHNFSAANCIQGLKRDRSLAELTVTDFMDKPHVISK